MRSLLILLTLSTVSIAVGKNALPYDDCKWFECAGIKSHQSDCISSQNCDVLFMRGVSYSYPKPSVYHRLYWIGQELSYALIGYSNDTEKGDDAVTACIKVDNRFSVKSGISQSTEFQLTDTQSITSFYEGETNGVNQCVWIEKQPNESDEQDETEFYLSEEMHVFLGTGTVNKESFDTIDPISMTLVSDKTFRFDPDVCDPGAIIFETFYCWRDYEVVATINIKAETTRFQLTFYRSNLNTSDGLFLMGFSQMPIHKNSSLVKCSWKKGTTQVSISEVFKPDSDGENLESVPVIENEEGHRGENYMECSWSRASNSWTHNAVHFNTTHNPLYLQLQKEVWQVPKLIDLPLVFPNFIDEELSVLCENLCFGIRYQREVNNECITKKNCVITLVVEKSEDKYTFSIRSSLTYKVWTSVSLLVDEFSGKKFGFDCKDDAKEFTDDPLPPTASTHYKTGNYKNQHNKRVTGVNVLNGTMNKDGPLRMTCNFEVDKQVTFPAGKDGTTVDLSKSILNITISWGTFTNGKAKAIQSTSLKTPFDLSKLEQVVEEAKNNSSQTIIITFSLIVLLVSLISIVFGVYLFLPPEWKKRNHLHIYRKNLCCTKSPKSLQSSPPGKKPSTTKSSPQSKVQHFS